MLAPDRIDGRSARQVAAATGRAGTERHDQGGKCTQDFDATAQHIDSPDVRRGLRGPHSALESAQELGRASRYRRVLGDDHCVSCNLSWLRWITQWQRVAVVAVRRWWCLAPN